MPGKRLASLLSMLMLCATVWSQKPSVNPGLTLTASVPVANESALPSVVPPHRQVIGLALEGGGALGLAHIGVLAWLEARHIPVDRITGTSMGSLIGGLFATGRNPAEIGKLAFLQSFDSVSSTEIPYADASFRRRQDRHDFPMTIPIGLKHGPALPTSIFLNNGIGEFLSTQFKGYDRQDLDFNRMPIPFRCVATDLTTLGQVNFSRGPLTKAVRASISIPGVFPPVQDDNGDYLVDGGLLDNLPTDILKQELHADFIVAVHLVDGSLSSNDTSSMVGLLHRASIASIVRDEARAETLADIVISVPVQDFNGTQYDKANKLIALGYNAAKQRFANVRPEVMKALVLNDEDWKAYVAARKQRMLNQPAQLLRVRVEGGTPAEENQARADLKPLQGHPINETQIFNALKPLQANSAIVSTYEVFTPQPAPGSTTSPTPDSGVVVHLSHDNLGPPYLLVNPQVAASTSDVSRAELAFRLIDQNLGGFGSELRANIQVGYMTDLSAEYYSLLSPRGYFLRPFSEIVRKPVPIWADQKRIADRFEQDLDIGLAAGRTFSNRLQLSAEWRLQDSRWSLQTGADGAPNFSGTAQSSLIHINLDGDVDGFNSPDGFRLSATAGALYRTAGGTNAPLVLLNLSRSLSFDPTLNGHKEEELARRKNRKEKADILLMSGEVNSYLRNNVAQPFRFTLGGPLRLSASSFEEYRGTDMYLVRTAMLRRIRPDSDGLWMGLYGFFGYEAGEIWSPEVHALLRQDGTIGLVESTPLGLNITLGGSVGDAGHRKAFITLGRWF